MKNIFKWFIVIFISVFISSCMQPSSGGPQNPLMTFLPIIYYLVFVIVGVLIGKDAKKRGMSPWGWGLFVFFLWIIALPLYFILRKPKSGNQKFRGGLNERIGSR